MPIDLDEFRNKVYNDFYKFKGDYPRKPKKPKLLEAKVADLTPEELLSIPLVMRDYQIELKGYELQLDIYTVESTRLAEQFDRDFYEAFDVPKDDPFIQKMYELAYDRGHSEGYSGLVSEFFSLLTLWEVYKDKTK